MEIIAGEDKSTLYQVSRTVHAENSIRYRIEKVIYIEKLYHMDTYQDCTNPGNLVHANLEIANLTIDRFCGHNFHFVPYVIHGYKSIDYTQRLPAEIIFAKMVCWNVPWKDYGSFLILVWFQEKKEDTFAKAQEYLAQIDWGRESKIFPFSQTVRKHFSGVIRSSCTYKTADGCRVLVEETE